MKKCIAIVLALGLLLSLFQVTCFAAEAADGSGTVENITLSGDDEYTYADYLEENKAVANATEDIFIAADSYSSADAAIEKVGTHTDEEEVKGENGMITDDYNKPGRIHVEFN